MFAHPLLLYPYRCDSTDLESSFYTEAGPKQQFGTFTIKTGLLNVLINRLTFNTYVLIVFPPGEAEMECAHLNVVTAQAVFARLASLTGDEAYKIRS